MILKSIEAKKGNPDIFFYLSKPANIEEPPVLLTIRNNLMMENYNELTSHENDSIRGQIQSQLDEQYPVKNHPLFPGKCIYAVKEQDFWELSPLVSMYGHLQLPRVRQHTTHHLYLPILQHQLQLNHAGQSLDPPSPH
ncbi:hypothetical protein PAXRUDRAFT_780385 [Paxillus rubicundulus Ve08.2h10]|uniref:Unplaced genomic scaffold scaffold_2480, whole genome shotgun sequence n=1 Tax=Paxillus rubicundulus Ve08.2h10 TaxID=930991 RepID=A0A0D0CZN5_9AGAM|nr:hypothetical protein PAXRUDRAFT_780385 [Paxillus rubicundulus Ve08.2h10]